MGSIFGGTFKLDNSCSVILGYFPYNSALFGLVSYNDPCKEASGKPLSACGKRWRFAERFAGLRTTNRGSNRFVLLVAMVMPIWLGKL